MMQALLRSACTWWCHARVWAGNIYLYLVFTVAIVALETVANLRATFENKYIIKVETLGNKDGQKDQSE